ncbi:MAG: DUF3794 domain-containing protein [Clostridia bacterium]|nr:DUF3794 domain-containing protein [Clostridia bacterium]
MIKAQYQTYTFSGETCKAVGQSVVECRLPALEVAKVLNVDGVATLLDSTCENGEVKYSGKLLLTVLYEDAEGKINRAERGAEFYHKAEGEKIAPAHFAVGSIDVTNISVRREGSSVFIAATCLSSFAVYGRKEVRYLAGGEGLALKKEEGAFTRVVPASVTFEEEDDFETEYAEGVLSHTERTFVTAAVCSHGQVEVSGEIGLGLCILKRDGTLCAYERLIPFSAQVPCDEAAPLTPADAAVRVTETLVTVQADEDKGTARIGVNLTLHADVKAFVKEDAVLCVDAYSPSFEVTIEKQNEVGRYLTNEKIFTERIVCQPLFTTPIEEGARFKAVVSPTATVTSSVGGEAAQVEGVIEAKLLCEEEGGGYACKEFSMPFVARLPIRCEEVEVEALACGVGVRRRAGGETEAEATLKLRVKAFERKETAFICSLEEGEAREENDAAISVYLPKAGDDLWTTAKRLSQFPEDFEKCNEGLSFPLRGDERLLIYRQKGEK